MDERDIEAQLRRCTKAMESSISATSLRMLRPSFGQAVTPAKGSVLASPVYAHWDPQPDYFFHWLRDSALVMDAVTLLSAQATTSEERQKWNRHFQNFVSFSLRISQLDGRDYKESDRRKVADKFQQFVRSYSELAELQGLDASLSDVRVNADGKVDFLTWSRPQYDGPALRALACLRHAEVAKAQGRSPSKLLTQLILQDLDYTMKYADAACSGIWEEGIDKHYYSSIVQAGALYNGAVWAMNRGDEALFEACRLKNKMIINELNNHWDAESRIYKSSRSKVATDVDELLDISVVLGVLHARLPEGRHHVHDQGVADTLKKIEQMFDRLYPINSNRPKGIGAALGRYKNDTFPEMDGGGGPWFIATLAAAEFYYKTQQIEEGDAAMNMVLRVVPEGGSLSEQFDKVSGAPRSARQLTWSNAAFVTAALARRQSLIPIHSSQFSSQKLG